MTPKPAEEIFSGIMRNAKLHNASDCYLCDVCKQDLLEILKSERLETEKLREFAKGIFWILNGLYADNYAGERKFLQEDFEALLKSRGISIIRAIEIMQEKKEPGK